MAARFSSSTPVRTSSTALSTASCCCCLACSCACLSSSLIWICCSSLAFLYVSCTDESCFSKRSSAERTAVRTCSCTAFGCELASDASFSTRSCMLVCRSRSSSFALSSATLIARSTSSCFCSAGLILLIVCATASSTACRIFSCVFSASAAAPRRSAHDVSRASLSSHSRLTSAAAAAAAPLVSRSSARLRTRTTSSTAAAMAAFLSRACRSSASARARFIISPAASRTSMERSADSLRTARTADGWMAVERARSADSSAAETARFCSAAARAFA
mmetsp:Transcript_36638/g.85572  ORF Transcript_36638/g.85572 Transcript_36638/m.85572 type:complete len:276 (+) Transcript_36638:658-1485(+)